MNSPKHPPTKQILWAAFGTTSGTIFEATVGPERPMMLPPCSNQDLPQWLRMYPEDEHEETVSTLLEALKEIFNKQNCVCRLNPYVDGPVPCETCQLGALIKKAGG